MRAISRHLAPANALNPGRDFGIAPRTDSVAEWVNRRGKAALLNQPVNCGRPNAHERDKLVHSDEALDVAEISNGEMPFAVVVHFQPNKRELSTAQS